MKASLAFALMATSLVSAGPDELLKKEIALWQGDWQAVSFETDGKQLPPEPLSAAGGLVSTVRDIARFEAAVESPLLLREETLAAAWTPAGTRDGALFPTGLGWFVQPHRAGRVVWHFGHVPQAYSSLILKLPERRLTFILLANSEGLSAPFQLGAGDITRSLFATLFLRLAS